MKSKSFTPYLELPSHTKSDLEIALGSEQAPRSKLEQYGWTLRDPLEVTRDPWTYQGYIQGSKGEFSVAKDGYVVARTGWFSERSACYLASGRPVILQDTGFSSYIHCEAGLLAFSCLEEAVNVLEDVRANYGSHCEAARQIAKEYFDSRIVLQSMIDRAMAL